MKKLIFVLFIYSISFFGYAQEEKMCKNMPQAIINEKLILNALDTVFKLDKCRKYYNDSLFYSINVNVFDKIISLSILPSSSRFYNVDQLSFIGFFIFKNHVVSINHRSSIKSLFEISNEKIEICFMKNHKFILDEYYKKNEDDYNDDEYPTYIFEIENGILMLKYNITGGW